MRTYIKDPDANLDYSIDWSLFLDNDTISTSVWTVPPGISQTAVASSITTTTIWLSGGMLNNTYLLSNRITTVGGRIDDRSFEIKIRQK